MEQLKNFRKNLEEIRRVRHLSLEEYSRELSIPKSTLQSILASGQTSLHTACIISENLGIPLSTLTQTQFSADKLQAIQTLLLAMGWFTELSSEQQKRVVLCIQELMEVLQK